MLRFVCACIIYNIYTKPYEYRYFIDVSESNMYTHTYLVTNHVFYILNITL